MNYKKIKIAFGFFLLALAVRFCVEYHMNDVSTQQIKIYCKKNNLPVSEIENKKRREVRVLSSVYDYTLNGDLTHRIRLQVTIFGQFEQHTLVE